MPVDLFKNLELGFSSYRYFPNELHPTVSAAGEKAYTRASRYENHDELEYFTIRSGSGILEVNGDSMEIGRGSSGIFMQVDFHRFLPSRNQILIVDYCRVSVGTYLFVMANPYFRCIDVDISDYEFRLRNFEGAELEDILRNFAELKKCHSESEPRMAMLCFMELLGKFNRKAT